MPTRLAYDCCTAPFGMTWPLIAQLARHMDTKHATRMGAAGRKVEEPHPCTLRGCEVRCSEPGSAAAHHKHLRLISTVYSGTVAMRACILCARRRWQALPQRFGRRPGCVTASGAPFGSSAVEWLQ